MKDVWKEAGCVQKKTNCIVSKTDPSASESPQGPLTMKSPKTFSSTSGQRGMGFRPRHFTNTQDALKLEEEELSGEGLKEQGKPGNELAVYNKWLAGTLHVTYRIPAHRGLCREKHQVTSYSPRNLDFLVS